MNRNIAYALASISMAIAGCQTVVEAEKKHEILKPVYRSAIVNGTNTVYISGYERASGGWEASARSPLFSKEELRGLSIVVSTNGNVSLSIEDYHKDLSTNAVIMTQAMIDGAVNLTEKIAAAVISQGGSASMKAISSLVSRYVSSGGSTDNATITCRDGSCTITDGSVTCTDGSCFETSK